MNDKIQLGLIVTLILSAQAGKVLFFMPVIPKSSKITWMPLAKELGNKAKHFCQFPGACKNCSLELFFCYFGRS
jgi:hypothetical protein